jgi:hypothetical protein
VFKTFVSLINNCIIKCTGVGKAQISSSAAKSLTVSSTATADMSLEAAAAVDQLQADESIGFEPNMQVDGAVDMDVGLQVDGMNDGDGDDEQVLLITELVFQIMWKYFNMCVLVDCSILYV